MNTLKNAVMQQLGCESEKEFLETCKDICEHGMDSGFGQFVYYADTVKFFNDNREAILERANELADSLGEDMLSMIASFHCLSGYDSTEVAQGIYEPDSDSETQVKNALAWFAAEEIAREVADGTRIAFDEKSLIEA